MYIEPILQDDGAGTTVLGVKEFHVAMALLEGQEQLPHSFPENIQKTHCPTFFGSDRWVHGIMGSWDHGTSDPPRTGRCLQRFSKMHNARAFGELVPSQWGPVHLFDLCLWFGHIDTAWALASHGVKGCTLEDHHLRALPDARDAPRYMSGCCCKGWKTCSYCCFGFPLENGVWMQAWDANLGPATDAAREAAKIPLVQSILEISSRNERLPLAMSEAAAARLLDIAILIGNVEVATNLAKTCKARPLRRWRGTDLSTFFVKKATVFAALFAGADFEGLHFRLHAYGEEVPLLRLVALDFEPEQWQQLGQFFQAKKNQWPTCDMRLGGLFLNKGCVSMKRIQNAFKAGWDLKRIWIEFTLDPDNDDNVIYHEATLLFLAIFCGQPDCAGALGSAGVELNFDCLDLRRWALRGDGNRRLTELDPDSSQGSASECKSAASAAAKASLTTSLKREGIEKGIALYQTLTKKFHPRGVPVALVRHTLGFSMAAPKILDHVDLWDKVRDWMPSWEVRAEDEKDDALSLVEDLEVDEKEGSQTAREPGTLSIYTNIFLDVFYFLPWDQRVSCVICVLQFDLGRYESHSRFQHTF